MPESDVLSLARQCVKILMSQRPSRSDLEMLNRLLRGRKVTLRELGMSPKEYVKLDHRIDVMTALDDLRIMRSDQATALRLARLKRLVDEEKVSLPEIGLERDEYEHLERRIEIVAAAKLLATLRRNPTRCDFNALTQMIKDNLVSPQEIDFTLKEHKAIRDRIARR